MASKHFKKSQDIPKEFGCPGCADVVMKPPIFLCKAGHSICSNCFTGLLIRICPQCEQDMTTTTNLILEQMIAKLEIPCKNSSIGCNRMFKFHEMDDHLSECIFRDMKCPISVLGKCFWQGKLQTMAEHFNECHQADLVTNLEREILFNNINPFLDDRRVSLIVKSPRIFILTLKIDAVAKMAYCCIQHIAVKNSAQTWIYDIQILSFHDVNRKMIFTEYCFNDVMKADEIFSQYKCAVVPLESLNSFCRNRSLKLKFNIRNVANIPRADNNGGGDDRRNDRGGDDRKNNNRGDNDGGKKKFNQNKTNINSNKDGKGFQKGHHVKTNNTQ